MGCATLPPPKETRQAQVGEVDVVVVGAGGFVVDALPAAAAALRDASLALRVPSTIIVHDDVYAFVAATEQTTPTLRAWSTWRTVHLLPPSTWSDPSPAATRRRVVHELCHLALWQGRGSEEAAARIPRFVVEGVCSVAADQRGARMPREQVLAGLREGQRVDFDDDSAFAYGLAHHVFAAVVACRGSAGRDAVVDAVAGGVAVEAALAAPVGRWLEEPCPPP